MKNATQHRGRSWRHGSQQTQKKCWCGSDQRPTTCKQPQLPEQPIRGNQPGSCNGDSLKRGSATALRSDYWPILSDYVALFKHLSPDLLAKTVLLLRTEISKHFEGGTVEVNFFQRSQQLHLRKSLKKTGYQMKDMDIIIPLMPFCEFVWFKGSDRCNHAK